MKPFAALPVVTDCEEEELEAAGSFCFVLNIFRVLEELFGQHVFCKNACCLGRSAVPMEEKSGAGRRHPSGWI